MMKKTRILILLIFAVFLFSGCGKVDIDKLSIATAIGLDAEKDGVKMTVQLFNPNSSGPHGKDVTPVIILSETGRTVQEAFRKIYQYLNNRPFYSHFQVLIIGEELARKGITPYIGFFLINQQTLHAFNVAIVQGDTAENLLRIPSILTYIPAIAIEGKIESSKSFYGTGGESRIEDILYSFHRDGYETALASLMIIGDVSKPADLKEIKPKLLMKASGIAAFKENVLQGFLSEEESMGYNLIRGYMKSMPVVVTKKDGVLASLEVADFAPHIKIEIIDGKPKITVSLKGEAQITEDAAGETTKTLEYAKDIEKRVNYEVKMLLEKAIKKSQELNADIIGFGDLIHKFHPKVWQDMIKEYDTLFPELEIDIETKITVTRILP